MKLWTLYDNLPLKFEIWTIDWILQLLGNEYDALESISFCGWCCLFVCYNLLMTNVYDWCYMFTKWLIL